MTPATQSAVLPATPEFLTRVRALEAELRTSGQVPTLQHTLHAGVYTRTIQMPKGARLVGALMRIPTTVIISGDVFVAGADGAVERITGANQILLGHAGRKQAMVAAADSAVTMIFTTNESSLLAIEQEMTDEWELLLHSDDDTFTSTGV